MNVAEVLNDAAARYGDGSAIFYGDHAVTIHWVIAETVRMTELFDANNVAAGDRVLLLANNRPEWLACYFATVARGAVLVPLNPALTVSEVSYIVADCAPTIGFIDRDFVDHVSAFADIFPFVVLSDDMVAVATGSYEIGDDGQRIVVRDVAADHAAVIFYTSGTTGKPKGVVLGHGATLSTIERTGRWLRSTPADCALVTGSLAFIMNSSIAAIGHLQIGAKVVLQKRFRPQEAAEAIAQHRVTILFWVPTMYVMAMEYADTHPVDFSSLRVCVAGGASLPWPVAEQFEQMFGKPVLSGWGMTEGTPITGFDVGGRGKPDSIGKALDGCEVLVVDPAGKPVPTGEIGELIYRSTSDMNGYYNKPAETAETVRDGWIWSGDLGWEDEDRYLYIAGRKKDLIIRGGANIYPAEIESVLSEHGDISESAVVGIPDARLGERVVAFVRAPDCSTLDVDGLVAFCSQRLAGYKIPEQFILLDDLPRGPTGKILKRTLREQFGAQA